VLVLDCLLGDSLTGNLGELLKSLPACKINEHPLQVCGLAFCVLVLVAFKRGLPKVRPILMIERFSEQILS
jgi:hypothetical protein